MECGEKCKDLTFAGEYRVPLIKLTGGQRIDLVGIRKDDLPAVWRDLDMPVGYAWPRATGPARAASERITAGSGSGTAWCWP